MARPTQTGERAAVQRWVAHLSEFPEAAVGKLPPTRRCREDALEVECRCRGSWGGASTARGSIGAASKGRATLGMPAIGGASCSAATCPPRHTTNAERAYFHDGDEGNDLTRWTRGWDAARPQIRAAHCHRD